MSERNVEAIAAKMAKEPISKAADDDDNASPSGDVEISKTVTPQPDESPARSGTAAEPPAPTEPKPEVSAAPEPVDDEDGDGQTPADTESLDGKEKPEASPESTGSVPGADKDPSDDNRQETAEAAQDADEATAPDSAEPAQAKQPGKAARTAKVVWLRTRRHGRAFATQIRTSFLPWVRRIATGGARGVARTAAKSRRFLVQRILPRIKRVSLWLLKQLDPRTWAAAYKRTLIFLHSAIFDRKANSLFFITTRGHVNPQSLTIPSRMRASAHVYKPTPKLVFDWAMSALPEDVRKWSFVDFGAGRGRALLLASHYPFESITGAEIARELHDDCEMNIAQYPRSLMKCRNVECQRMNATGLPIPDQPTVFYFFNPFDDTVLEQIIDRIVKSHVRQKRDLVLICVDMPKNKIIASAGIFQPSPLGRKTRLKAALFSPYAIEVFRTGAAEAD